MLSKSVITETPKISYIGIEASIFILKEIKSTPKEDNEP